MEIQTPKLFRVLVFFEKRMNFKFNQNTKFPFQTLCPEVNERAKRTKANFIEVMTVTLYMH